MVRAVVAVVAGLVIWFVAATLVNLLFRALWPGYAEVEIGMNFTPAMLFGRLLLGVLSSLCAGLALAWIAKGNGRAAKVLGILLTLVFIPVHYHVWDKFPLAYHLIFLASLLPVTVLGARLLGPGSVDRHGATT